MPKTEALTLGRIAAIYKVRVPILLGWISCYDELDKELQTHIKDLEKAGLKILPPALVEKIFAALGEA